MKNNTSDIRTISDVFVKSLKGAELKQLVDIVKQSKDLIVCFRDGYINIYYKSHSIFRIEEQTKKKRYKFSFDLGHARYTSDFESVKLNMEQYNVEAIHSASINKRTKKEKHKYEARFFINKGDSCIFLNEIISEFKKYIDDFFDEKRLYDFFKCEDSSGKKDLIEKKRQQEIFMNHSCVAEKGESLLFYDMELSIPNMSQAERKKGSPDCMAIKLVDGKFAEVVLIEVKSNQAACKGGNGIKKHYIDFNAIICNEEDRKNLYKAMQNALKYYEEIGIYPHIDTPMYDKNIPFSIKYIFTDEAINWMDNKRQKNDNYKYFLKIPTEQIEILR